MPVNFRVICDTVPVTGKTIFCITISKTLCKNYILPTFLKAGLEKGKRKAKGRGQRVIVRQLIA